VLKKSTDRHSYAPRGEILILFFSLWLLLNCFNWSPTGFNRRIDSSFSNRLTSNSCPMTL